MATADRFDSGHNRLHLPQQRLETEIGMGCTAENGKCGRGVGSHADPVDGGHRF
jgi:hypothetical protein